MPAQPVLALTHVLVGAVDEAALYIAQAEDPVVARADMDLVIRRLTQAFTEPP
jgi:Tetracyclin repressor-like, C-terminal domain